MTKVTPEQWRADQKILFLNVMLFKSQERDTTGEPLCLIGDELIARTNDAEWRRKAINILLDRTEEDDAYAKRLDRYLGLPTDADETEHRTWWSANSTKATVWFSFLSVIISIVALLVALFKK